MSDFRYPFKTGLPAVCLLLAGLSCDIPRDNPLDPGNPDSVRPHVVMVDAFVNTENSRNCNEMMISALDSLKTLYGDRIEVAEFHRHTASDSSSLHLNENELLYSRYLSSFPGSVRGVPDVFINGVTARVQGASSVMSALFRLQGAVEPLVSGNGYFTLEVETGLSQNRIEPRIHLARLGRNGEGPLRLRAVLVSRIEERFHRRVVRGLVRSAEIAWMQAGEQRVIRLPAMETEPGVVQRLLVSVTDAGETRIYQTVSLPVE